MRTLLSVMVKNLPTQVTLKTGLLSIEETCIFKKGYAIMIEDNNLEYSSILHNAIHEVIENQIRNGDPKETKQTLERLMKMGYNRHESIHKIGTVLIEEMFYILKKKQNSMRKNM